MTRRKIAIKKIENLAARQVAFSKRWKGLFKKAMELSTFWDAEIALLAFCFQLLAKSLIMPVQEGEYVKLNKELRYDYMMLFIANKLYNSSLKVHAMHGNVIGFI
ncbi:hypothetical protein K1719_038748 [Acacia pycnantha]|nr:hypothetical protein K1719_038748 [Acacia pycnantha]